MFGYVVCWTSIRDGVRVKQSIQSYMDLELPSRSGDLIRCRIGNAYCPYKKLAHDNPNLLVNFCGQLKEAIAVRSNVEIFVLGEFNSKLERMTVVKLQF